jgi:hypothetical protein
MEALLFLLLIIVGISTIVYFMRKTSSVTKARLARKEKHIEKVRWDRAEKLATAGSARLSDKDEVWRTRRNRVSLATDSANKTVGTRYFKYAPDAEPTYDGYCRSDRHHIKPARISPERHLDDIVLPGDEPKRVRAEKTSQPRLTP